MTKKEQFLRDLNQAFANNDVNYVTRYVTDDIERTMVGEDTIRGKKNLTKALREMENDENLFVLQINDIIIHQNKTVVEGSMISGSGETYAFCDIYTFASGETPIIKKMTSYVITITKKTTRSIRGTLYEKDIN